MHSEKRTVDEEGDILWVLFHKMPRWARNEYGLTRRIMQEKTRKSASMVQPTERETAKDEVQTVEGFTVERSIDAYSFEGTNWFWLCGSEVNIEDTRGLVRRTKTDGYLQKEVPVSLKNCILHAEHYPPIYGHPVELRM